MTSKKLLRTMNQELRTDLVPQGLFITFEGSEGCGKSTQIARLAEQLRVKNPVREIILLREPGGTVLGEQIRHLLQYATDAEGMAPEAELLLFSASRAQLVRKVIRPALERGAIVLCDRFADSTTVYQGVARAMNSNDVAVINDFSTGGLLPDVTILLDLDVALGRERMAARNKKVTVVDRMEQEPEKFYEDVRRGYLELASKNRKRWMLIDASGTPEEVAEQIFSQLQERINGLFVTTNVVQAGRNSPQRSQSR